MKKLSETRYMQFIAAFAAALSGPVITTHIIWTSPALPILQSSNSPLGRPLTIEEASWLVSLIYLVSPPGGFLSAYIAQKFGRKISLLMGGMASMVSWIIITFAQNLATLYIGRGIGGVSMGMITAVSYIYLGEIADDNIRGMLGMLNVLVGPISSIIIFIVGPYVPYKVLALLCCALPVLYLIVFVWMPETPHFFIKKGNTEGAKRSLTKLSARNCDKRIINEKIAKLQQLICDEKSNNKITLLQFWTNWRHLKPFFLMTGILLISLLSGSIAIESYMQTIISVSKSSLSPEVSSIIFGIVKIPPVLVAIFLCDKLGRRPLFAISCLGCAVALFSEGLYFYTQEFHEDHVGNIAWLPTTALSAFMIMLPLGLTSVPHILLSEVFPIESKEISSSFLQLILGASAFGISKTFAPLATALGVYTMFWFFSGICLLGSTYVYLFVPETKGKSFAEIQELLYGKKNASVDSKSKIIV